MTDGERLIEQTRAYGMWSQNNATGCWEWQEKIAASGYGRCTYLGTNMNAHDAFYTILVGPIPKGRIILQTCGMRHCVNPDHLKPAAMKEYVRHSVYHNLRVKSAVKSTKSRKKLPSMCGRKTTKVARKMVEKVRRDLPPVIAGIPIDKWIQMYRGVLARSAARMWKETLTFDEFLQKVRDSGGRCTLTGRKFEHGKYRDRFRNPWAPSLDRIDSSKSYTVENTRLVCSGINYALSEWGAEVFQEIACSFVGQRFAESRKFGPTRDTQIETT